MSSRRFRDATSVLRSLQKISCLSYRSECRKFQKFVQLSDAAAQASILKNRILRSSGSVFRPPNVVETQKFVQEALERSQLVVLGLIQWVRLFQSGVRPGSGGRFSERESVSEAQESRFDHGNRTSNGKSSNRSKNIRKSVSGTGSTLNSSQVRSYHISCTNFQKAYDQSGSPPPKQQKRRTYRKISENSRESAVPSSRVGRLANYGSLAVGLGVGALAEVTRQTLGLSRSKAASDTVKSVLGSSNPFLTEANAERIVDTLCRVRGAALKLGQMLSIQDSSVISPELQKIFERVRDSADFMPARQVEKVMRKELGENWEARFQEFDEKPFAAASIGQVHRAVTKDGREVAMKIQYPGVAKSINSDINNLMSVMSMGNLIPKGFFLDSFVTVARKELGLECDYLNEAEASKKFGRLLKQYPEYYVPEVFDDLTTKEILTTELVSGLTLDKCVDLPQETRDWLGSQVLFLCLRELFELNYMQTDPNWSNFFFDESSGEKRLILLDFGASRAYDRKFVELYMKIIKAATEGDRDEILKYSRTIGFLTGYETKVMNNAHVEAVLIMGDSLGSGSQYDFGAQDITPRMQKVIPVMLDHRLTPPPEEIYSLHRKLLGAFLICAKLGSRVWCKPVFDRIYENFQWSDE